MAGLTRTQIQSIALGLVNSTSADQFYGSTLLNLLSDEANRQVYRLVCDSSPEYFETVSSFSWPANTESLDVTGASYLVAEPYKILTIEETPRSGAVSQSNLPITWKQMRLSERSTYLQDATRVYGRHYCLQGTSMYVAPIPAAAAYVKVHWIAQLAALSGDSTEVLGGLCEPFGAAVAYCLANMLNSKQEGQNPIVANLWAQAQKDIEKQASKRAVGPTYVKRVGLRR